MLCGKGSWISCTIGGDRSLLKRTMRILFLSRWFPCPPSNGSKLRIYNLLRGLSQHHEVTLLSFADQPELEVDTLSLQSLCRKVQVVPWKPFNPHSQRARLGFFSSTPRSVLDTFSIEMAQAIQQLLSSEKYDIVIASQIDMAVYNRYFCHLPALFEELEIGVIYERFARASSLGQRIRNGLTWAKYRRYLAALLQNYKVCTVVSNRERQLVRQAVKNYRSIEVIPNCIDTASYADVCESPQPNSLVFTGSFTYLPNYEAMYWFISEVYPRVQAQIPEIQLTITGNHANRSLPSANNVFLSGFVDDVRPLVARAGVSVVPLHTGGGTRLKILEAMALGTPVVATSKGAEGLDIEVGKHLSVADTPEAFAGEIVRLLREPGLRQRLADNARQLVRDKYDWNVIAPYFLELVEQVAYA